MKSLHVVLLAPLLLLLPGRAQDFRPRPFDWPQWQGPDRNNTSREAGLLQSWPKDGPRLVWKANLLGGGYSVPSVAAGRIIGMSYLGEDEIVWALEASKGKLLWKTPIAKANRTVDYNEGSRCSPTIEGDALYALGVDGDLVCLRVADGAFVWRRNLVKDFDGILPFYIASYGYTESPLIDGDRVVVTPGGTKATVVALDKKTGKTIWTVAIPEPRKMGSSRAAYASLVASEVDGVKHYVQFLQGGLVGVSREGKLLWRWDTPSNDIANCTTPIVHQNLVFASSGYGKGCGLARLVPKKDELHVDELYFNKAMKNVHGGMVLVDGYVYGNSDPGYLVCLELAAGKVKWQERAAGRGSIVYADGHLYYRDEAGPMLLVEANPEKYIEKGRFSPPGRSKVKAWSHPVIANGHMLLRDQEALCCYDIKR